MSFLNQQITRKQCIKKAYFVKPLENTMHGLLFRTASHSRESRKITPTYNMEYLIHVGQLDKYIEKAQLTTDYGGTMQYNHIAWVDFQRVCMH